MRTQRQIEDFREKLMKIGDSVVVVNDEDIIKVHVHSNAPEKYFSWHLTWVKLIA